MTLLQNEANLYYKTRQLFLLQNEPFLLQNAAGITKCAVFITKRGRYYKMRRLLHKTWHNKVRACKHKTLTKTSVRRSFSAKFRQAVLNHLKEKDCSINATARNFGIDER